MLKFLSNALIIILTINSMKAQAANIEIEALKKLFKEGKTANEIGLQNMDKEKYGHIMDFDENLFYLGGAFYVKNELQLKINSEKHTLKYFSIMTIDAKDQKQNIIKDSSKTIIKINNNKDQSNCIIVLIRFYIDQENQKEIESAMEIFTLENNKERPIAKCDTKLANKESAATDNVDKNTKHNQERSILDLPKTEMQIIERNIKNTEEKELNHFKNELANSKKNIDDHYFYTVVIQKADKIIDKWAEDRLEALKEANLTEKCRQGYRCIKIEQQSEYKLRIYKK